ncbi:MAG: hypothetical protein CMH57_15540 [Myxococcales bacterium]|nr:hypothetical protein [Myxococcales bacterium]
MSRNKKSSRWGEGLLPGLAVLMVLLGAGRAEAILTPNAQHDFSERIMDVASWAVDGFAPIEVQARRRTSVRMLAKRFGSPADEIRRLNGLGKGDEPERGTMLLLIPRRHPRHERHHVHLAHLGETFESVAWAYKVCVDDLVSWNWRVDARRLKVGTALRIHRERRRCDRRSGHLDYWTRLGSGPGYRVRTPSRAWGTKTLIHTLRRALVSTHQAYPDAPRLQVGDISHNHGGPIARHLSHRVGRDVDVGYYIKTPIGTDDHDITWRFQVATPETLEPEKTWHLISELLQSGKIKVILMDYELQGALYRYALSQGVSERRLRWIFQYPKGYGTGGMLQHYPGHADHFHVRVRCQPDEEDDCEEDSE